LPQYTLRDGPLNLASTLPKWCLPPDLGPKLYFGFGALSADGSFAEHATSSGHVAGTCLHVDMADAVNICCHVEPLRDSSRSARKCPALPKRRRLAWDDDEVSAADGPREEAENGLGDEKEDAETAIEHEAAGELKWLLEEGETGAACWDIWHAKDAQTISNFLLRVGAEEGRKPLPSHGIHDQVFYIDAKLRKRLEEEEGVRGWRFVQRLGDAVFIPCGAPHQVLNLRSCIKSAMDFVSPQHIERSLALTQQFRQLPRAHPRQADPLGTHQIVLHAMSHALSVLSSPQSVHKGVSDGSHLAKFLDAG